MSELPSIYQAELDRVHGNTKKVLEEARHSGHVSLESLPTSPEERAEIMRWWRMWAVTLSSAFRSEWNGKTAAQYLNEARDVIRTYYYHESSWEAAKTLKADNEGHEYQMAAEMCRDEGKFHLNVASLTGNSAFIATAIESFDEAIHLAENGTSVWAVATMEKEIAQKYKGKKVDFATFTQAYNRVVSLSPHAGGWDRMATVSWWYAREALFVNKTQECMLGMKNLKHAADTSGVPWVTYPLKDILSPFFEISRKATKGAIDSNQFKIS